VRGSAIAGVLVVIGVVLAAAWPEFFWPGLTLASLAALFAVLVSLGYVVTRGRVKRAQVERATPKMRNI
jgi:hypothetical protein